MVSRMPTEVEKRNLKRRHGAYPGVMRERKSKVVDLRLERYKKLSRRSKQKSARSAVGKATSNDTNENGTLEPNGCTGGTKKQRTYINTQAIPMGHAEYVENFRQKLRTGVVAMDAVRHFIQQVNKNPDYILSYLRAGGTLQPLVDILEACEKEKLTDIADMFNIIHSVLLTSIVFDETQEMLAIRCARYIMSNYKLVIVRLLRDKTAQSEALRIAAFRILKAFMLIDSQAYTRDILRLMDAYLPELEMHKNRETVVTVDGVAQTSLRTVFIEFNLAFLIDTAPEIVRLWLARSQLIQPLVQNLVFDHAENVILVMKSLRQYVLDCAAIDKYIYRTIFTTDLLKALVNTYEWVGPEKEVPTKDKQRAILNATEEVVLPLLTSKRFFLVPPSIDLDRANSRHKHVLLALKNSQLHSHQRRLVLRIFESCPEVLPAVLENYGGLLKTKAANNRELLMSILKLLKPEEIVASLKTGEVSAKALSNFVIKSTLPRTALAYISVAIGKKENIAFCLEMLAIMITQCEKCLLVIERTHTLDQFGIKKLKFDAINQILAFFPSVDRIMGAMEQHRNDRTVQKTNIAMEHAMDILLVCIRSFRPYVDSSSIITTFNNLLKPAYRNPAHELYYLGYEFKAIKVVIALEPQSISFDSPLFGSVLMQVTKVYLNATPEMYEEATELLLALFRNTTLFGNRTTEIEFWFQALYELPSFSLVPEMVQYLAKSVAEAAQKLSNRSSSCAAHSLIDQAFEKGGSDNLDALFARIEQEDADYEQLDTRTAEADLQLEHPVTDNFFLYMFASTVKHPEKFDRYFNGVLLRYLHYLPHPELVEKALALAKPADRYSSIAEYVRGWMAGKECILHDGWDVLSTLSRALIEKKLNLTLLPSNENLTNIAKKQLRSNAIHMLHQMMFHLSRLIVAKALTQQHMDVIAHYADAILSRMFQNDSFLTDTDTAELMAGLFLQRPVLLEHFTVAVRKGDADDRINTINQLVTGFMFELMEKMRHLPNFDRYIIKYSNKIISELINSSTRELVAPGSMAFDVSLLEKLRSIFKLNDRHCITLLCHYTKLPVGTFFGSQQNGNERTFHYEQLCYALVQLASHEIGSNNMYYLTEKSVHGLMRIYTECSQRMEKDPIGLDDFEDALHKYFNTFTHSIAHVSPELFGTFFATRQRIGKPMVKLAAFLLARDARFDAPFLTLLGQHDVSSKKELVYPLLSVAFQRPTLFANPVGSSSDSDERKRLLMKLYVEFKGGIQKMLEKPHKAAVIYRENTMANKSLVRLCMPRNECVDFGRKKLRIEAVEVFQLRVLMEIYGIALEATQDDPKQQPVIYANGFVVLLQCFEVLVRSSSSAAQLLKRTETVVCLNELVLALYGWSKQTKRYQALRETNFGAVTSSANWNTFCKICLKFGIDMLPCEDNERRLDERLHVLPKIMAVLVDLFYENDNKEQQDIARYYDWALTHSLFLRVFLVQFQFKPKTALAHLLFVLARKNPAVTSGMHVPLLLGAYWATMTDCNRYILGLLQLYERAGVQMHDYRPFLWGETAIKHYALEADANRGDSTNPDTSSYPSHRSSFRVSPAEVLSLLAKEKITFTIQNFPVWRRLDGCANLPEVKFDDVEAQSDPDGVDQFSYHPTCALEEFVEKQRRRRRYEKPPTALLEMRTSVPKAHTMMYDPAFLLPMLGYLFSPEHGDMLSLAGKAGLLPLPFVCLASYDEQMRLAAGCVILRIRGQLEQTANFIDSKFWIHLFSVVQNGAAAMKEESKEAAKQNETPPKVSFLSTFFIAQTINILPDVMSDLHGPLTRYILHSTEFDFRAIPNFIAMFHSADVKHNVHRLFILETICSGIQTHDDFDVLRVSPVIRALMQFYASALSNRELNITILNIFDTLTKIPKSCEVLVDKFGFLAWLNQRIDAIESFHFDTIETFLGMLSNCWYSIQLMTMAANTSAHNRGQQPSQHGRLSMGFSRVLLIATLKFLPLLSTRSSSITLIRFLNLLEKTTSQQYSSEQLLTLVSEPLLQQMLEYFEQMFGKHLWCVRYVRQCGTHCCDDEVTMGKKLRDNGVDQTTLSVVLSFRQFVVRWHNYQKIPTESAMDVGQD